MSSAKNAALACLLLAAAPMAAAHDYWVEKNAGAYVLFQGHVHSTHKGEERVPYDPAIVKAVVCANEAGNSAPPAGKTYPVRVSGACAAILFELSSGYWTQTLTDTVPKPRNEVRGALRGWRSEESIKRLDAWTPASAKPLGEGLELLPLDNPFTLKPGDKLTVQVNWRGKPRRGVAVAYSGDARGVTDAQGRVNVRVRHGGVQIIAASFDEALSDPLADKVVRGALLQFDLPK